MSEIVYILTNEAMPDLVKIGVTSRDNINPRVAELSQPAGVPLPFKCHFAGEVDDEIGVEKLIHQVFAEYRINPKREFFRIAPEKAVLALKLAKAKDVTPNHEPILDKAESDAAEAEQKRRSRTKLSALGILPGTVLTFTRDPNITCEVIEGNKVEYEGQSMAPSVAAKYALEKLGQPAIAANGYEFWMVGDKTIWEIRMEKENPESDDEI
jgi:T5orf172 domain